MKRKQVLGQIFKFRCGHKGILPKKRREGNDFALWQERKKQGFSNWVCRKCNFGIQKKRRYTPLGSAKSILATARNYCKKQGYLPPDITAEDYVILATKSKKCVGCKEPLPPFLSGGA